MKKDSRKKFLMGLKDGIPILIGFLPIAATFAMLAMQSGLSKGETNLMSICVLAGASQMMAVQMIALGAAAPQIIVAVFLLNLRHLVMSSYIMNKLKDTPIIAKCIIAFGVTDETFAVFSAKSEKECSGCYFAGLAGMTYFSWIIGTFVGSVFIEFIPESISKSMGIALYAMFIAIIVPEMGKGKTVILTVLSSAVCNTVLSMIISSSLSLIISMLFGAGIGVYLLESEEKKNNGNDIFNNSRDGNCNLLAEDASSCADGTHTCSEKD